MREWIEITVGWIAIMALVGSFCFYAIAFGGVGMEGFTWRP